jgi:DDE superfamily endonuclease
LHRLDVAWGAQERRADGGADGAGEDGRTAAVAAALYNAAWSDEDVLAKVREMVLPAIEKNGPIEAWIIDDTSFPKQGKHSVGVHHQYCGQLGKQANCQAAVSLSIANHAASLPAAYRLYLPEAWTRDRARRKKAGVPKEIKFRTKPQIALEQINWACDSGLPRGVALMDSEGPAQLLLLKKWALANGWQYSASGVDFAAGPALAATGHIGEGARMLEEGIAAREANGCRALATWNRMALANLHVRMLASKERPSLKFALSNSGSLLRVLTRSNREARCLLAEAIANEQIHKLSYLARQDRN